MSKGPIDTVVRLTTPERITFEYPLAGPFPRFWAYLIDWTVWTTLTVALLMVTSLVDALSFGTGTGMGLFLVAFFIMQWGFGAFCEMMFNGRTPGKRALQLRVVSENGGPISPAQAIIRNLLAPVDTWPFGFMVGLASVTFSDRFQRLGDLAAGTMVVIERRPRPAKLEPISPKQMKRVRKILDVLPPRLEGDRDLVRAVSDYMARRKSLEFERREEMTKPLAHALIARYRLPANLSPDDFIAAVYARLVLGD